jgi:transglycosylase-like protein with SLT domain
MLLVAAAVSGEPMGWTAQAQASGSVGGGLSGLTDPGSSADGSAGDDDFDLDDLDKYADGPGMPNGPLGIPGVMLDAYMQAARVLNESQPGCHMHWSLLASIGRIESNHARGGRVDSKGNTTPHILGPVLNGGGFAAIKDSDGGKFDEDGDWDRAVGNMQFIPSTWKGYAADGNGDGVSNPHNVYDATVAAGKYLCSGGMDMNVEEDRAAAVFRYNRSDSYVRTVLIWADAYAKGVTPLPSDSYDGDYPDSAYPGQALPPGQSPNLPPAQQPPPQQPPVTTTTTPWSTPSRTTPPCGPTPAPTTGTTTTTPSTTTTTPTTTSTPPSSTTPTSPSSTTTSPPTSSC